MKFCAEVANLWYKPLLRDFCEGRKIEISLEHQGFQRFGKKRLDLVLRSPKPPALPTALHPVIELFYPAGRILPKQVRYQLRCTRRCPTPPIIAELRLSFKLFFGQPTFFGVGVAMMCDKQKKE